MAPDSKIKLPNFPSASIVFVLEGEVGAEWPGIKADFKIGAKQAYLLLPDTEITLTVTGAGSNMFICSCDL